MMRRASGETVMAARPFIETRTQFPKWMWRNLLNLQTSSANSNTTRVTPTPPGFPSAGTAQSTGSIYTLIEDHAHSGWLCELVVGSNDAQMRECEYVDLLEDARTTEHVCGPHDFTHATEEWTTSRAQDRDWRTAETLRYEDRRLPVSRRITSSGLHRCETTNSGSLKVERQRHRNIRPIGRFCADSTVLPLNSHGVVVSSFSSVKLLFPMLLPPVDEEPTGEAPDLSLTTTWSVH